MTRITAEVTGDVWAGAHVGDEFVLSGIARIVGIEEELIDVTSFGEEPGSRTVPGERAVKLLITNVVLGDT